jgi:DNA replication protein DnaC
METPQVLLEHYLKQLKLPTILREYAKLAEQCAKEGVDFQRFLLRLVEAEMLERDRKATERRIKAAKFAVVKSLETFDFLAIPSLNKKLVLELARCEWVGRRENVLALGNSGTGKTHIALALGLAACQRGMRVRFTTAAALVHELLEARDEKRLLRFQKHLQRQELLIVDELGFVPLSKAGAEMLFEVFSQRYERGLHAGDIESAVRRMDRGAGLRAADRGAAGPADAPRTHPGDERGQLPAERRANRSGRRNGPGKSRAY